MNMQSDGIIAVAAGRPLLAVLDLCHRANLPVLLRGGTGIGKSAILEAFAKQKEIGYISRDLSLMEPPDLVGMPQVDGDRTRYLPPAWLPGDGEGILVLEEINRAPEYMRAPCLMLLTDRSLHDYELPPGWLPMAAINPVEDGYEAADLDPALLSRFVQINVVPNPGEWLTWAGENGVHDHVMAYVGSDATVFNSPTSNPRSWTYVSRLLHAYSQSNIDPSLLRAAIAGCVGLERATAFLRCIENGAQPLTAKEILSGYCRHRKTLQAWVQAGKLDVVEATILNVEKHLQAHTDFLEVRSDAKQWRNLGLFLADLPGDLLTQAKQFFGDHQYPIPRQARKTA
jgi:hypothetical protein